MNYIITDNLTLFHMKIAKKTGGSNQIRDVGIIDAAVIRPFSGFGSISRFPSIEEKISATAHSIIKNHPFIDGNKRTGIAMMLLLLKLNDITISCDQCDLVWLGLSIAEGKLDVKDIAEWIIKKSEKVDMNPKPSK